MLIKIILSITVPPRADSDKDIFSLNQTRGGLCAGVSEQENVKAAKKPFKKKTWLGGTLSFLHVKEKGNLITTRH